MESTGAATFDPYHKWLGIRDPERPPNHYRLLGLEVFEDDPEVIEDAAVRQLTHIRKFTRSLHRDLCLRIIEELYVAKAVLLDRAQRTTYDRILKQQQQLQTVLGGVMAAGGGGGGRHGQAANSGILSIGGNTIDVPSGGQRSDLDANHSCPDCGWENGSDRQFCGGCGTRLWEPCIACGFVHSISEKHCGRCGVNHATAIKQRLAQEQEKLVQVQSLVQRDRLDEAEELLKPIVAADHPQLQPLVAEAKALQIRTAKKRTDTLDRNQCLAIEAQRAFDNSDYERAAILLEQLPDAARTDQILLLLDQVRQRQMEVLTLKAEIKAAIDANRFDGLLPKVERMLELQPNHKRSLALAAKLRPYERKKLEKKRDRCRQLAQELVGKLEFQKALEALQQIPAEVISEDDKNSREIVGRRAAEVAWLAGEIVEAVEWDEQLLPLCERAIKLAPNDERLRRHHSTLKAIQQRGQNQLVPAGTWPAPPAESALGFPIARMGAFKRIAVDGAQVPDLADGPGAYCVAAGLALQGLGQGPLQINLLPREGGTFLGVSLARRAPRLTGHAAWGLDIGHTSVKALKLVVDKANNLVVAQAAARVPHREPLDRFEGDPLEIIIPSLKALLEKFPLNDAPICLGVSGQLALSRFFMLPMMEEKKVASAMQFETRNQIPFPLEEVVLDYQVLHRRDAHRRDICEREMALFAIRKEYLNRCLAPLKELGLRPAIVQSQCAALHNLLAYDRLTEGKLVDGDDLRYEGIEPAIGILDIGSAGANLVITGDGSVWCRYLQLGGNHFSVSLIDQLNVTFAQAEKFKRNPSGSSKLYDAYQALRPVFAELMSEIRRSVEYFINNQRRRKVVQLLVVGDAARLHGLLKYLWLER